MNSNQPTWTNERRKLSDLIPWERNPRKIEDKEAANLIESFEDFGQVEPIAIGPDNGIYNAHQRLKTLAAEYGMDYEVDVRVSSRLLTEQERKKLTIFLHHSAAGEWDLAALAEWDTNDFLSWDFDLSAFDVDLADQQRLTEDRRAKDLMGTMRSVDGYDFEIDAAKLGYRIEAIAHCKLRNRCLELFAGRGLLTYWYGRLFEDVVRVDVKPDGQPDHLMKAEKFMADTFDPSQPFDFVDFDDEGCPSEPMQIFFSRIASAKWPPFVLCVTDGAGLNLKSRGKMDLQKSYRFGEGGNNKASTELYEAHTALVEHHLLTIAAESGYVANRISLFRGSHGNVTYGCYKINCAE